MKSEERITALLIDKYGVAHERITPVASMADLGLDSLSVAEMVFDIEDMFEITFEPEDADFSTFGEAVTLVDRYLGSKGG